MERGGTANALGLAGKRAVADVFCWWYRFKDGEVTRLGLRRGLAPARARFQRLLKRHEANPDSQAYKMARDLIEY